jgi:hypothetical protein
MRRSPHPGPHSGIETRSPLGKQTCNGMGESRFRVTRRPRPAFLPMNREMPTVQSEHGLSQTAARMLARALNLHRGVGWRSAASWGQLALRRQGRFRGSMRETLGEIFSPREKAG